MSGKESDGFPNGLEAFFLVVALLGATWLAYGVLSALAPLTGMEPREFPGVAMVLGNGLVFSALLAYKRMGYASLFHSSDRSFRSTMGMLTVPVLLLVPGMVLASWTVELVLEWAVPMADWEKAMFERMVNGPGAFVTVCLLAPVVEEMLFRGIILRSFLHQYPSRRAIAGSAFIFGLAHLNLYQFVTAFLFGLVAGWLYERSRSLWPPILLHAACNFTSVLAWYHRDLLEAKVPGTPPALWMGAFLLAFVGTTLLQRIFNPARPVAAE